MDEELHHHEVDDAEAEDHPPEERVRTDERAVGEGECGDDKEEDSCATRSREDVGPVVGSVISKFFVRER